MRSELAVDGILPSPAPVSRKTSLGLGLMALIYLAVMLSTHTLSVADSPLYSKEISDFAGGERNGRLWEFDHVSWRPLAYAAMVAAWPGFPGAPEAERRLFARRVLDDICFVSGGMAVLLFWLLAREASRSDWIPYGVSGTLLCSEAFLNFSHAGTSYVPGLMLSTLGLWLLGRSANGSAILAWMAGLAMGGAVLLWIPYVFSMPACLLMTWYWLPRQKRWSFLTFAVLGALVIGILGYGAGAVGQGFRSVGQLRWWMQQSVHANQTKNLLRLVIAFPRTFIDMGHDGILYKRFLLHDPYAPVRVMDLVQASLWKIGLFYAFLTALIVCLWGNRMLFVFAVAAVPHLALGLLYEAGSPERYMPMLPFLAIVVATAWAIPAIPRWARWTIAAFLLCSSAVDLWTCGWYAGELRAREAATVSGMKRMYAPGSIIWTFDGDLGTYIVSYPFDLGNRPAPPPVRTLYPRMNPVVTWKQDFSRESLLAWARHGEVWISRRYFATRPRPEWYWAELDQPDAIWTDYPAFFNQLDMAANAGGADGFVEVAENSGNRKLLEEAAK